MSSKKRFFSILFVVLFITSTLSAQEEPDWRATMTKIIYKPRYFGPLAFPHPDLEQGRLGDQFEVELRGEYHYFPGDKTSDLFLRTRFPLVKGKVAFDLSWYVKEHYKLSEETRKERFAYDTKSPISYEGDIIIRGLYQMLQSKNLDLILSFNFKTASGGRLVDARFTDAASYWFDAVAAHDIVRTIDDTYLRIVAQAGFYCWMTNDLVHRQNDAVMYGFGLLGGLKKFSFQSDIYGLYGYEGSGDRPLTWKNRLSFRFKDNKVTIIQTKGFKDNLYNSIALSYTRFF